MILKYYSNVKFLLLNLFGVLGSLQNIVIAFIVGNLTNFAINKSFSNINLLIVCSVLLILVTFSSQLIFNFFKNDLIKTVNISLRTKILHGILVEYNFNTKNNLGLLVNDFKILENDRFESEISIIISLYTLIFALGYSIFLNWFVTSLFIIGSITPMVVSNYFQKPIQESSKTWSDKNSKYLNNTKSLLNGKKSIYMYNTQTEATLSNKSFTKSLEKSLFKMNLLKNNSNDIISTVANLCTFLLPFLIGIYLVIKEKTSLGSLFAIVQLSNSFINPVLTILKERGNLSTTKNILKNVIRYLDNGKKQRIDNKYYNDFNIVSFNKINIFRNKKEIIRNLDITIKKHEKIAIVGKSGSGKSTLLEYLIFQKNGNCGFIKLNGEKIINQSIKDLYGYANQEESIFEDTLKFNLTFNNPNISDNDIKEVCNKLNILDIIKEKGLNYNLSSENSLSGGQIERINLARTILFKRPILILDEISASLDNETSLKIHDYLLKSNLTVVEVIHHYKSNDLKMYDKVINLDNL
ncbi:ATP-binding cassette domain-containing protein [Apilactobacillus timberlakei]|nr:ABC transporter ATP-binding protein [Apilactobacillus timberlakei]